jgi:hypothetical protein
MGWVVVKWEMMGMEIGKSESGWWRGGKGKRDLLTLGGVRWFSFFYFHFY